MLALSIYKPMETITTNSLSRLSFGCHSIVLLLYYVYIMKVIHLPVIYEIVINIFLVATL